ncbi:Bgr_08870 family protein [Bartonella harrusi]|uniref:Glycine-rich domain-containing protein n=1 Tax=Bartonella harrusi TaxID=2961895 RepID=A0ABY5EYD7_9HYPH|nr:Bgr_08870 family protein [Bartonella harrusi]UTO29315.1 hypothetical protein NMK50_05205 [Bartonella harrusi]
MTKTKKLAMELPKEGRFISSEFPILRENLTKLDQAIMEVEEKLDEKAPAKHTHSIGDVADLEAALKGKMAADKTFTLTDLSDIEGAQDAANNYVLYKASNNHFTFGSAVSLLGAHQHKIEDIVGLDRFRAKINEDLTSYGRLAQANEWQNYNKFTRKVTIAGGLELIGNSSLNLMHNGEIVTSLSITGSKLKGPLKVDGAEVYSKDEAVVALQEIRDEITKLRKATSPLEVLVTESGPIPWPEGVSDNTDIEIWAWGGGGGGGYGGWFKKPLNGGISYYGGGGAGGGRAVYVKIKASQLRSAKAIDIGRGGRGASSGGGSYAGGYTRIAGIIIAYGGAGGGDGASGRGGVPNFNGGRGGDASFNGYRGSSFIYAGGNGGDGGSGNGGNSFFGGGGGAGAQNGNGGYGGESQKGGHGGKGCNGSGQGGGGGGGYFLGEDGSSGKGGNGGNGAVLLRFFI